MRADPDVQLKLRHPTRGHGGGRTAGYHHPYPDSGANGFIFADPTPEAFLATVRKAVQVWEDRAAWKRIQVSAMQTRFSWENSARKYMDVYSSLHLDLSDTWRKI